MARRPRPKPPAAKAVFINCPFDDEFKPLLRAMVFAIIASGHYPRCALDKTDGAEVRVSKIAAMIGECDWGIHDLSRVQVGVGGLPRFNMPMELGLLGQRAVVLVGRQRFEPIGILRLQLAELGDGVLPTPGAAAMVGWATGADHRRIGRARDAVTGLALGVGHGFLADRLARHGATPNRYVTKPGWCGAAQARFLKRQLSLPVSTMSQ